MSAYIVDNETICAIVKAAKEYGLQDERDEKELGQWLLNQNYKSVNYRYNKYTPTPEFEYKDVEIDEGIVEGCIACYNYQACETPAYYDNDVFHFLMGLRRAMLDCLIERLGLKTFWGYPSEDELKERKNNL